MATVLTASHDQKQMRCSFSQQLLVENLKSNKSFLVINSVRVLLQSLSCFDATIDKEIDDERSYIVKIIHQCLPEIFRWIDHNFWNWEMYMERCCLCEGCCKRGSSCNMSHFCEKCGKEFARKFNLERHILSHSN